jgi:hypothetical protein
MLKNLSELMTNLQDGFRFTCERVKEFFCKSFEPIKEQLKKNQQIRFDLSHRLQNYEQDFVRLKEKKQKLFEKYTTFKIDISKLDLMKSSAELNQKSFKENFNYFSSQILKSETDSLY